MSIDALIDFAHRGLMLALWVSLPAVLTSAGIGLLFAVLQATTQLQDQTTGQITKLVVTSLVLLMTAGWLGWSVLNFADDLLRSFGFQSPAPLLGAV